MPYLLLTLALLAVLLISMGYYFARVLIFPINRTYQETTATEIEHHVLSNGEWESYKKLPITINSSFGYILSGFYLPCESSQKTVVISHGITNNLMGSVKYAKIFQALGFNALIYDHRNHGKSGGKKTTFGYYEREDLKTVVEWAFQQLGDDGIVGIHGESMGAAIALLAAKRDERIAFIVSDCSYANLADQISYRLKEDFKLPSFPLLPLAKGWARLLTGMRFNLLNPEQVIGNLNMPVLIIHGEKDAYILPQHARRLENAAPAGQVMYWLAPDADHAESLWKNPDAYAQKVQRFLEVNNLLHFNVESKL
jgi:uncharacterized protein